MKNIQELTLAASYCKKNATTTNYGNLNNKYQEASLRADIRPSIDLNLKQQYFKKALALETKKLRQPSHVSNFSLESEQSLKDTKIEAEKELDLRNTKMRKSFETAKQKYDEQHIVERVTDNYDSKRSGDQISLVESKEAQELSEKWTLGHQIEIEKVGHALDLNFEGNSNSTETIYKERFEARTRTGRGLNKFTHQNNPQLSYIVDSPLIIDSVETFIDFSEKPSTKKRLSVAKSVKSISKKTIMGIQHRIPKSKTMSIFENDTLQDDYEYLKVERQNRTKLTNLYLLSEININNVDQSYLHMPNVSSMRGRHSEDSRTYPTFVHISTQKNVPINKYQNIETDNSSDTLKNTVFLSPLTSNYIETQRYYYK
ncbi:hypothetical protein BB560_004508 [Smittium megazygosporum]|uniref:Uncharacterized protein n=1 Tax=Smittium megazygosporum TaxID=133381 RepID=A0A2T9Z912_9FUNG|nr:hypothetical protein BB560_004508 [Smittium megazygosporum]